MSPLILIVRAVAPRALGLKTRGAAVVAERDGELVAAVSLTSGAVVTDPDRATADAVRALRHRRYEILRQGGNVLPLRSLTA